MAKDKNKQHINFYATGNTTCRTSYSSYILTRAKKGSGGYLATIRYSVVESELYKSLWGHI